MDNVLPRIHKYKNVDSVLDTAHQLYAQGRLDVWESIIAEEQNCGRGQLRRNWVSPAGNLYACWRLPLIAPLNGLGAPVIVGIFCALGLAACGFEVKIKWPNDLILELSSQYAKCGGILLEERNGLLVAGIGINITSFPPVNRLRPDASLPACALCQIKNDLPKPEALWQEIVRCGLSIYKDRDFSNRWTYLAQERFIWLGQVVEVADGPATAVGIFDGISNNGAPILQTESGRMEIMGGDMRLLHL